MITPSVASLAFGAAGVFLCAFGLRSMLIEVRSRRWPSVLGTVTSAVVREHVGQHKVGATSETTYWIDRVCEYVVNGTKYDTSQASMSGGRSYGSREAAESALQLLPVGSQVQLYYDPAKPAETLSKRGLSVGTFVILGCGLGNLAAAAFTVIGARH